MIKKEALFQLPHVPVGDRMLFKHHSKHYSILGVGMDMALSLPKVYGVLLGTPGVSLDLFSLSRRTGNLSSNTSKSYLPTTTLYVFKKYMAKTSISRLSRCWLRDFSFLVLLFLKTKTREDRLSAFTGIFHLKRLL